MTRNVTFDHQHNNNICNNLIAYGNASGCMGVRVIAQGLSLIVSGPQVFKIN